MLITKLLPTPIGTMVAIGDEKQLYLLEFADAPKCKQKMRHLQAHEGPATSPLISIENELEQYFTGALQVFETPLYIEGTTFQKNTWQALQNIPYAETASYAGIAHTLGMKSGFRAVAQANGANRFAIAIPCHRVISSDGTLGGYSGGIMRKKWLLAHERLFN
jgi:O-6-methylguanine DNA methyltransferase